ncbi:MAG: hypothetical protein Q7S88_00100 [Candidatus Daviesbacteria bacterium]|nr:hypothetical protein [Candidatus Daviesbacteria bacterium]
MAEKFLERKMFGNGVAIPKEPTPHGNDWQYVGFIGAGRLENNYIYTGNDPLILSIPEQQFGIPKKDEKLIDVNIQNFKL